MIWLATPKSASDSIAVRLTLREPNGRGRAIIGTTRHPNRTILIQTTPASRISWSSEDAFAELLRRSARAQTNRRGRDLEFRLPIEFIESIAGADKRLTLPDGNTLNLAIPPGVTEGQVLRLRGKGAPAAGKGDPGDVLIELEIKPDRSFTRQGDDIYLELPITLTEAVLGARIKVPTPTGTVTMSVPRGSNAGSTLRLRGKGAPKQAGGHGDQLVKLKVMLPKEPNPELEAFVTSWEGGKTYNPREEVMP